MIRLLCLVSAMNAGGAETFLMKIYRRLDRTRFQMDFCVNVQEPGFYDEEIRSLGGRIHYVPAKTTDFRRYARQLKRVIADNGYTHVLRITANGLGFLDCAIAKWAGARHCAVRSSNSADAEGLAAVVAHRLGRLLFARYIDVKIAPSDLAAKYTFGARAYDRGRVSILHNGLDVDAFAYDKDQRRALRAQLGIDENTQLLGHVGRFMKQKNHPFLVEVFSHYHKAQPDSKLLLVGDGEAMDEIRRLVEQKGLEESVVFAGVRKDVPKLLSAMDVLLLPSFYEGMPNVVVEAQANGLPCVISDTITREADVTGLVRYLPIAEGTARWVAEIGAAAQTQRSSTGEILREKGYDIDSVVRKFEELCLSAQ